MIDQALLFVTKQLNQFLKRELAVDHTVIELTNIPAQHSVAKLFFTLIQIEEEASLKNQLPTNRITGSIIKTAPPMYLNLQFLISVSPNTPYVEGLKYLTESLRFFQRNPILNSAALELPKGIDKLAFEISNLDFITQQHLWQSLDSSYQPSVVYKMRMLEIGG